MATKIKLKALNQHLTCVLCGGYYIDATTIVECLHSFCRTCIVRYLETHKFCPICDVQIHKTRPLANIRSDQTLQDIVYKLVPGLFKNEMKRRREFYTQHPEALTTGAVPSSSEGRGEVLGGERLIFTPEDTISISLEYCPSGLAFPMHLLQNQDGWSSNHRRYLRCPGALTVGHLKKLLRGKYGLSSAHKVDITYVHDNLQDGYTMIDLAYIYSWRRNGPIRLFYKIRDISKKRSAASTEENFSEESETDVSSVTTQYSLPLADNSSSNQGSTDKDVFLPEDREPPKAKKRPCPISADIKPGAKQRNAVSKDKDRNNKIGLEEGITDAHFLEPTTIS